MQPRGYSLVQVITVIGIISILFALATPEFTRYLKRSRTEAQIRMLCAELLRARANALYQGRATRVKLFRDRFEIYSSAQDGNTDARPVQTQALGYPVTCNGHGDWVKGYPLDFDVKGMASNWCSICLGEGGAPGAVDSVVISVNRVSLGKRDKGDDCNKANITIR